VLSRADLTTALALPHSTQAEIVAKTTAINDAIISLITIDITAPTLTFNPTSLSAQYTETAIGLVTLTVTSNEDGTLYVN